MGERGRWAMPRSTVMQKCHGLLLYGIQCFGDFAGEYCDVFKQAWGACSGFTTSSWRGVYRPD